MDSPEKIRGQFKLRVTGIMANFKMYGMDIYIPGAVDGICQVFDESIKRMMEINKVGKEK